MVSIIVATYNGEKFLARQLNSLAAQTYKDLEIIICDDGSTDNTQNVIKEFAGKHSHVSYYFNESNLGINKNFEQGFLKAKGEFIAIADQDDIWKQEKIEEQMRLFSRENILVVHSASALFNGNQLPVHKTAAKGSLQMTGNDSKRLLLRNSIAGHNIIFRKELLNHILPLPADIFYDWWLCEVATCHGEIASTNKIQAYQRQHDNNVTVYKRTTRKQNLREYTERKNALEAFSNIKALKNEDKIFIRNLLLKFKTLETKKFSLPLFFFLMKNASVLFFYKTKAFPFFSYIKTAYRMSFKKNKQ